MPNSCFCCLASILSNRDNDPTIATGSKNFATAPRDNADGDIVSRLRATNEKTQTLGSIEDGAISLDREALR